MPRTIIFRGAVILIVTLLVITVGAAQSSTGTTTLVSVDSAGVQGDDNSWSPALSADGRFVAFESHATNLVAGDNNTDMDIFVHDRITGITERVSVDSAGVEGNGLSRFPSISGDGQLVAFYSYADNLVPGDTNGEADVFVHNRQSGQTTRVSVDSAGNEGDDDSFMPHISRDGRFVAFHSEATNLVAGDTNGVYDIFVHDRQSGDTTRVSVSTAGAQGNDRSVGPQLSGNGRYVVFDSEATNLVAGDSNFLSDVFLHDRQSGQTRRVSTDAAGAEGNNSSLGARISGDAATVVFTSLADNLVPGDTNGTADIFARDVATGVVTRLSVDSAGVEATGDSIAYGISGAGRYVTFISTADNLVPNDTNGTMDSFLHDRQTGETTRVSVDSSGDEAGSDTVAPVISRDGRVIAFHSGATNLVPLDSNGIVDDIFIHERAQPVTPTPTATASPSPSPTSTPPPPSPTATPSPTPPAPTATPTATAVPPTPSPTPGGSGLIYLPLVLQ